MTKVRFCFGVGVSLLICRRSVLVGSFLQSNATKPVEGEIGDAIDKTTRTHTRGSDGRDGAVVVSQHTKRAAQRDDVTKGSNNIKRILGVVSDI